MRVDQEVEAWYMPSVGSEKIGIVNKTAKEEEVAAEARTAVMAELDRGSVAQRIMKVERRKEEKERIAMFSTLVMATVVEKQMETE